MPKKRTNVNNHFNAVFPAKNMLAHHKKKAESALQKAKKLDEMKISDGMIWVKDPVTKSMKLVKLDKEVLKA